jgi:hypothetical protein
MMVFITNNKGSNKVSAGQFVFDEQEGTLHLYVDITLSVLTNHLYLTQTMIGVNLNEPPTNLQN